MYLLLLARTDFLETLPSFRTVFIGQSVSTYVVSTNVTGHNTDYDVASWDGSISTATKRTTG
jgi:hypothetical protein